MASEHDEEHHKKVIHRIHRIQGQLNALERSIVQNLSCEETVIQSSAVEKAVSSLIECLVSDFLDCQIRDLMKENPDEAIKQVKRILQLSHR